MPSVYEIAAFLFVEARMLDGLVWCAGPVVVVMAVRYVDRTIASLNDSWIVASSGLFGSLVIFDVAGNGPGSALVFGE